MTDLSGILAGEAHAIEAARLRALGVLDKAVERLNFAQTTAFDCLACEADLERRAGRLLLDLGDGAEALRKIERSKALYRELGNEGHDLFGNGLGNCAENETYILLEMGEFDRVIEVAEAILPAISPFDTEDLYISIWFNLCVAILRRGGDTRKALELCEEHVGRYVADEPCQNLARMFWFRAKIHEAEGRHEEAVQALEKALWIVEEIELRRGVAAIAAIVADLERLNSNHSGGSLRSRPFVR